MGLWGLPNHIAEAIAFHEDPSTLVGPFGLPGIVHVADRIAHHPEITDPRAPELQLNFEYLERTGKADRFPKWRQSCAVAIAQGSAP